MSDVWNVWSHRKGISEKRSRAGFRVVIQEWWSGSAYPRAHVRECASHHRKKIWKKWVEPAQVDFTASKYLSKVELNRLKSGISNCLWTTISIWAGSSRLFLIWPCSPSTWAGSTPFLARTFGFLGNCPETSVGKKLKVGGAVPAPLRVATLFSPPCFPPFLFPEKVLGDTRGGAPLPLRWGFFFYLSFFFLFLFFLLRFSFYFFRRGDIASLLKKKKRAKKRRGKP